MKLQVRIIGEIVDDTGTVIHSGCVVVGTEGESLELDELEKRRYKLRAEASDCAGAMAVSVVRSYRRTQISDEDYLERKVDYYGP